MKAEDVPAYLVETVLFAQDDSVENAGPEVAEAIRRDLAFVLTTFAAQLYEDIECAMNRPVQGCACPSESLKSCGWREGHHAAAMVVKAAVKGTWT
jgi:hypothetical protein